MAIDDRTVNRNYKLPAASNLLAEDVARLRDALAAIDADVYARYTKSEVDQLIQQLINGAPGALDTLNELAAALGNDSNFATTLTNLLAQKANSNNVYSKAESDARYVQGQTQAEMVFIATASQSVFALSTPVINKPSALVTVDGVVQPTSEYSLNMTGTELTLSEGVPVGTIVRVLVLGVASVGAPADDTVTTAKLRDGALAATVEGRAKMANQFVTPEKLAQPLTLGIAVATTSGTSIDITGIPSWVKRVTLIFSGVSTNGTNNRLVQIGSGSVQTTGYVSAGALIAEETGFSAVSSTAGFIIRSIESANNLFGTMTICLLNGNTYVSSHSGGSTLGTYVSGYMGGGRVTLPGTLDRIRITTTGADTFDSGTVNVLYEG
jgi:hypothetical protein